MRRYAAQGRFYDVLSLEAPVYRRPRLRLLHLLAPAPGSTVVDLGCGTGLNFPGVVAAIGPQGRLIGVDRSASMLAAARRRVGRSGWSNVVLLQGDVADLDGLLGRAGVRAAEVDAVLATFVLSVVAADAPVWDALDRLAEGRRLTVAVADIGPADSAPPPLRLVYRLFAALGGARPERRPWLRLAARGTTMAREQHLDGHVELAVVSYDDRGADHAPDP